MENTVEEKMVETPADDALTETLTEEVDASEPIEAALQEAVDQQAGDGDQAAEPAEPAEGQPHEPGWIRKRIDKAVAKAVAEAEQRVSAEYEKRFAPMMEKMLDAEAKDLVRQGEFKSLDRAKEYLQLKQGVTPRAPEAQPPRDEQGRFAPQPQTNEAVSARADLLARQAEKIKNKRGLDVMAEFNSNDEIRQKIVSGEWDFYDVAEAMAETPRRTAPAPMRSPNGASGAEKSKISTMTDEQFERFDKRVAEGKRYSLL